ncbi:MULTISPECIES: SMP-30/gluconolactonase/LRE family protein [Marinobacter]|uniref:SMP-30/gluconolactonase/LRE family protein n=1 Tax=Marinobacter TaxID=2742 RepID=UPI002943E2B9|nr:SMP-30/gluconolactonase/LRE family protein [Marinobacter salarius]WOI20775.1 SMP-30/gluconolactonase/LRE family protein [Marinobacter salarius]
MKVDSEIIAEGLAFPEGPRWRNNLLWFSDFYSGKVYTLSLAGQLEKQIDVPSQPSGLGWTPEGHLLVVSMIDRKLLRWDGKDLEEVVDLSALAGGCCNDMYVANDGTAFVGNFGFDIFGGETFRPARLIKVTPNADVEVAAEDMHFPNGTVVVNNGQTLIVAESFANRLTAFDIDPHGALSRRRVWADLGEHSPDGLCLDRDGGIWVATPGPGRAGLVRVAKNGEITHEITVSQDAYACALTCDGRYLLVCTSAHAEPSECLRYRSGRIEKVDLTGL